MAGADQFTGRGGQINDAGVTDALFLKQFSGEVLSAFDEFNVMMPLHTVRTISSGKSAQFPVIGDTMADYHSAGTDMLIVDGQNNAGTNLTDYNYKQILHNERTIAIDDMLVAPQLIPSIDEAKSHYDYRSEYTRQMGAALARQTDRHLIRSLIRGAFSTTTAATDLPLVDGGGEISLGGVDLAETSITSAVLVTSLFEAAARLDASNIPDQDRYVVLTPTLYYNLLSGGTAAAFDISTSVANSDIGGSGFASGKVPMVAGFEIYKSNNVNHRNTVYADPAGGNNDYSGLTTDDVLGLVFHKSAVGTVKLLDLSVESEYIISRQATFMVAKYAMGHGMLRPEASIALTTVNA